MHVATNLAARIPAGFEISAIAQKACVAAGDAAAADCIARIAAPTQGACQSES
jgi:hypothetical protein